MWLSDKFELETPALGGPVKPVNMVVSPKQPVKRGHSKELLSLKLNSFQKFSKRMNFRLMNTDKEVLFIIDIFS